MAFRSELPFNSFQQLWLVMPSPASFIHGRVRESIGCVQHPFSIGWAP